MILKLYKDNDFGPDGAQMLREVAAAQGLQLEL